MNLARVGNKYLTDTEPWKLLKENPERDGTWNGFSVYKYNYIADDTPRRGVIAQEVEETRPEAIAIIDGVKHVNYSMLAGDL